MYEETTESLMEQEAENTPQPSEEKKKKRMELKSILLIVNVILFVGMIILFILFFSSRPKENPVTMKAKSASAAVSIACVNSDSILVHYELVTELRKQLEESHAKKQQEIEGLKKTFDKKVADFQQKTSANTYTPELAKINEQQLLQEQQKIMGLQEQYANDLSQQELDLNIQLLDSVTNFLKRYNKTYKFDYILNIKKGGDVFLSNETLDITKDVIEQLNKEYNARKK